MTVYRHRRSRRLAQVVRRSRKARRVWYRYAQPVRQGPTVYTRPYTSTRAVSVEWFEERFVEVNRSRSPNP